MAQRRPPLCCQRCPPCGVGGGLLAGSMAGGGMGPDWWSSAAAAAALGPEWLSNILAAASVPAPASAANEFEEAMSVPIRGASARRGGGRGGRAPRTPAPIPAAPVTVDDGR